ncbi:MAG TPA: DUF4388 domain-containing protein [Thermoanaerobaculia bacterium]|nr:DUF4388 domain-containing protein [Thermoanaerobaculia bacterium]
MSITGNLRTMELAELLQWLSQSKKTGTLVVDNGKVKKQIFFRDGRVFSSASSDPREHLGSFLVSHGFITEMELTQAIKMQATNKMMLGKILTTVGAVSEADLHNILRLKAEEGIFDVFTWPEGDFNFLDKKLPENASMVPISLDVDAIILEGGQRFDEWKQVRAAIPGPHCVPVRVGAFVQDGNPPGSGQVLALVDDERSIEDLCRATRSNEFHVSRILLRQITAGVLKIVKPRVLVQSEQGGMTAAPVPSGAISGEALLDEATKLLESEELDGAMRHLRAARALEPDSPKLATAAQKIEDRIRLELERSGLRLDQVPILAAPMEELSKLDLSPQQGFLLTRIDGATDLASLVKLGPLPPLDTQLLFWRLRRQDVIRLEAKKR